MDLGLREVARFGLCGRHVADRFEQAAVVEPIDPFEGGERDGLEGAPWAAPMDYLGFEPEALPRSRDPCRALQATLDCHNQRGISLTIIGASTRCARALILSPSKDFATLECELLDRRRFATQAQARMAVFTFIEGF